MAYKPHLLALCVLLPACASNGATADAPARLTARSPETHDEIAQTVATALHRTSVAISDDAFEATSSIIIEPVLLQGRETRSPERFVLVKRGTKCVLKRERTGEEWELKRARCTTEAAR